MEAVSLSGFGFEGPELTQVIYQPTAYTLPPGMWELEGTFSLLSLGLPSISVAYGLTESLQLSTSLSGALFGMPGLGVKAALGGMDSLALVASAGVSYFIAEGSLYVGAGLVASLQTGAMGIHPGISLQVLPTFSIHPYAAFDYSTGSTMAVLGELGFIPVSGRMGVLFRMIPNLDLRAWAGFPSFTVGASAALRF